jgi:transposase
MARPASRIRSLEQRLSTLCPHRRSSRR